MKKVCFFHLGFHKTASSYLQGLIRLNQHGVLQRFHVVNRSNEDTRPLKQALAYYGRFGTAERRDQVGLECKKIMQAFEESGKDRLLLSEEVLLGYMLRQAGETQLYSGIETNVALIIESFSDYELQFLCYTREPDAWFRSLYNQAVKQVRFAGSFKAFLDGVDTRDIWGVLRARLETAAAGRAVHFFSMENDIQTEFGTGYSLLRHIGLNEQELAALERPQVLNASWPSPMLELMRKLNASDLDPKSLSIVRDLMKKSRNLFKA